MNLEEFNATYSDYGFRDRINIICGCGKSENLNKDSAIRNIKQNGLFICRVCSLTDEGRVKISEATSYERTAETKEKMSQAAYEKWNGPKGLELRKNLSNAAAKQQRNNGANIQSRRYHYHNSPKAGMIYLDSSYELKMALLLDADPNVITYKCQIPFTNKEGFGRRLDFLVTTNSDQIVYEIKPLRRVNQFEEQIKDNEIYAQENKCQFKIITEKELGFESARDATKWADEYLSNENVDYTKIRRENNNAKVKKYYAKKIAVDKVKVFCEYCQLEHEPLRKTYEKNIARNGRYICEKEGGFIAGSKPKLALRKINPYAAEGKKQCIGPCGLIKLFEEFDRDKSKPDGRMSKCKTCRKK